MQRRFPLALLAVCSVVATMSLHAQTFVFHLSGDQEVPPVDSTHSGGCMGVLDQPSAQFSITCVHDVFDATVMHIHRAGGAVAFGFGSPVSPVTGTWTGMTPADISELLAGDLYINIHTAGRPGGEIRGQILPRTVDTVAFTADGSQVVPPGTSPSSATCTANLDDPATSLAIDCTHTVASADAAHVHQAPFGELGPVIYTFPSAASPLSANVPLNPELVASFAATFLYLDIHAEGSEEEEGSGDEIRGQIGTPPQGAETGSIVIRKETFPAGGTGFGFTESITPGPFTLDDGGTRTFTSVVPGTYTVAETTVPAGYSIADLSCDDGDSTADPFAGTATIRVAAGETVTCTFRNFESAPADTLFVFHLSGDQETTEVITTDRGGCMGRFDAGAGELSLVCTHDVDGPTVMHIHRAPAGGTGPAVFDLGEPTSPVVATWSGMTPADVADLLAGNLYVNIHTAGRPDGQIRGQIVTRTVDTIAFPVDSSQVVPPGTSPSTGNCTADLSADATQLAVSCTHNLPAPEAAHVHDAPRGENGPEVFTFASPASPINQSVPLTPRLVADFAAYFLYLDIHGAAGSEETAGDQIRGQIAPPVAEVTTGTIRIIKSTEPGGGTGFAFTHTIAGGGAFTLDDAEVETFTNVTAGTYTVTEGASGSYTLTDIVCTVGDSTTNPFARTATIVLEAGETVTCTFRNLRNVASPQLFVFHLDGAQEVPESDSTARGGCFGQFDAGAATLSLLCTHNVIGPSVAHIHRGAAGTTGPAIFDLGDPISPIERTWTGMTPADIADLLAGNLYVNIHAGGRPEGEIRGQILPRTVDTYAFPLQASQEVPPTDSTATGNCTADLADNAASVFVQCTHDVDQLTDIHLHAAPPGVDGPAIFNYPLTSSFSGTTPLSPRLIADFAAGFLYVNVHSTDYDTGEIRGQLIGPPAPSHVAAIPTASEWALLIMALTLTALALRRL